MKFSFISIKVSISKISLWRGYISGLCIKRECQKQRDFAAIFIDIKLVHFLIHQSMLTHKRLSFLQFQLKSTVIIWSRWTQMG